jgi:hypothetical protein
MKPFSSFILKDFPDDFNSKYGIFLNFSPSACSLPGTGNLNAEVKGMVRGRKDPSSGAVSAASMKGNAGPKQKYGGGKRTSQNQQYKKENME